MQKITKKKRAAIICTLAVIALMTAYLVAIAVLMVSENLVLLVGILAVYTVVIVAVIVGVLLALRQRLKEIESGEEDEAKRY